MLPVTVAERWPHRVALITEDRELSFAALEGAVAARTENLRRAGFGVGDKIAMALPNSADAVIWMLAVWRAGAVLVDLNPTLGTQERDRLMSLAEPQALIRQGSENAPDRLRDACRESELFDIVSINLTSGSTGAAKGVLLPAINLVRNAELYIRYFGLNPSDITCLPLPLFFGMNKIALIAHLLCGATVLLEQGVAVPNDILASMTRHCCTGLCAVPAVAESLMTRGDLERYPLKDLRYLRLGAGRIDPELRRRLRSAFPDAELFASYGLTEIGLVTVEDLRGEPVASTSVGQVIQEVRVRIREDIIEVACEHAARGYYRDPPATAEHFQSEWVRTGDLGTLDAAGNLLVVGRLKEQIKVAGENISPAEIEVVIGSHPAVMECAVIGVPDRWLGEAVLVFVALSRPVAKRELYAFCTDYLRPSQRPGDIVILDSIPRNATGKIDRTALRDRVA